MQSVNSLKMTLHRTSLGMLFLIVLAAFPSTLFADATADKMDKVASQLDAAIAELEQSQSQSVALQAQLARLEKLTADHQVTLTEQAQRLDEYQKAVVALEEHDRQSLAMASAFQASYNREHLWNSWLWPIAGTTTAMAILEGILLLVVANK